MTFAGMISGKAPTRLGSSFRVVRAECSDSIPSPNSQNSSNTPRHEDDTGSLPETDHCLLVSGVTQAYWRESAVLRPTLSLRSCNASHVTAFLLCFWDGLRRRTSSGFSHIFLGRISLSYWPYTRSRLQRFEKPAEDRPTASLRQHIQLSMCALALTSCSISAPVSALSASALFGPSNDMPVPVVSCCAGDDTSFKQIIYKPSTSTHKGTALIPYLSLRDSANTLDSHSHGTDQDLRVDPPLDWAAHGG